MKKIVTTSVLCFVVFSMYGQFVQDYLKAADRYFSKGDYASAAAYYEKYFGKDDQSKASFNPYTAQTVSKKTVTAATSKEQALWNLAESYRQLNYPEKAEPLYKQVIEQSKDRFPLALFHHSTMLRALARYSEAETGFQSFLSSYTMQDEYKTRAEREIQNLRFIQKELSKKDLKYYSVKKDGGVNAAGATYASAPLGTSMILFTSTKPLDTDKDNKYKNRLYQASLTAAGLNTVEQLVISQPEEMEQGVGSATPDGNTIFFTRWSVNVNQKTSSVFTSTRSAVGWSEPVKLGAEINAAGSNNQQPFITSDGKYILFSSDRAGGQGGYDIWYAELSAEGNPGTPVNAGSAINTAGDEQSPSYHAASETLVFASNGKIGMGGYDLFKSKGKIGSWTSAENLGYPVNSIKDDMYFLSMGSAKNMLEKVWLSSDREAACCLELFNLNKVRPLRQISGTIVSCDGTKLLPGATVILTDAKTNQTVFTGKVGADGVYRFTMEEYQPLVLQATADGFLPGNLKVSIPADVEAESMNIERLCLVPEPPKVNESFVVENVFYEYDKSQIKPESFPALDQIVKMLNTYPKLEIEISGHTDSKGSDSYNQKLSEARAKAVVDYLIRNGIARDRLSAKGYGESLPVEPNENPDGTDNPEGREKNRRTEFKVIRN